MIWSTWDHRSSGCSGPCGSRTQCKTIVPRDLKLGDDTIDVARFDAFVEMLPRLRLNHRIDSWTKLSKEAHVHKQTLKRYAKFLDLRQWLPEVDEQLQQEDDDREDQA